MIELNDRLNSSTAVMVAAIALFLFEMVPQKPLDCFLVSSLKLTTFLHTPNAPATARRHMFGTLAPSHHATDEGIPKFGVLLHLSF